MDREKVDQVMTDVVARIKSNDVSLSSIVARKLFRTAPDAPARRWSWANRALMYLAETGDARTFNQWKEVGRNVKKGARAVHIFAPVTKKVEKDVNGKTEEKTLLLGFRLLPVFPYEMTEGKEIPEYKMDLGSLPFLGLAHSFGLEVKSAPTNGKYAGYFSPYGNEIVLCTEDPSVWLHELAHAVDKKLCPEFNKDYDAGELVAETSACVLLELLGLPNDQGRHNAYLRSYGGKDFLKAFGAIMDRVEAVISFVIAYKETEAKSA